MHIEVRTNDIRSQEDYREALKRFLQIMNAAEETPEAEELFALIRKMQEYEMENCM
ncbi:MAG: hypothetical protein FWG22_01850 [Prolixibacteraceae bacterium]|nr:hypothetical protein [Prolixibacteraceae bacterium]